MRARVFAAMLCAAAIIFACAAAACTGGNAFTFLSVRLRGNGDGTVTARAQNEFDAGSAVIFGTLRIYRSDGQFDDTDYAELAGEVYIADFSEQKTAELTVPAAGGGYFCAELTYIIDGEEYAVLSGTVHYDAQGNRI